jgi:putative peptidoglycan lipid II flippase
MFKSSISVTLLSLIGSILSLIVQLLIAKKFGSSKYVDANFFYVATPSFIASTLGGIINYVSTPRIAILPNCKSGKSDYIKTLIIASIGLGIVFSVLGGWVITPIEISLIPSDSPLFGFQDLQQLLIIGWLLGGVQLINSTASVVLNACNFHLHAALSNLIPNLGQLVLFWLIPNNSSIIPFALSGLLSTTLSLIYLLRTISKHLGNSGRFKFQTDVLKGLITSSPNAAIALSCFGSWTVIDSYLVPQIGPGALSTLAFAQRFLIAMGNFSVIGPITVFVPVIARLVNENNKNDCVIFYLKSQLYIIITSILSAALFYKYGWHAISLVFRNHQKSSVDAEGISAALVGLLPGMIGMLMSSFAFRVLFCIPSLSVYGSLVGASWSVLYFVLCWFNISSGISGVSKSYNISWIIVAASLNILLFIYFSKKSILKPMTLNCKSTKQI